MVPLSSLAPEDPHQYEDISKYSEVLEKFPIGAESSTGEFSVTACPAYMPTTRSAQLETEYDEVSVPIERQVRPVGSDALSEGQGSAHHQPEYEVVNIQDQKPEASVVMEYEAVKTVEMSENNKTHV